MGGGLSVPHIGYPERMSRHAEASVSRDEYLRVRLTKEELRRIDAARGPLSRSAWVRAALKTAAVKGSTQ